MKKEVRKNSYPVPGFFTKTVPHRNI